MLLKQKRIDWRILRGKKSEESVKGNSAPTSHSSQAALPALLSLLMSFGVLILPFQRKQFPYFPFSVQFDSNRENWTTGSVLEKYFPEGIALAPVLKSKKADPEIRLQMLQTPPWASLVRQMVQVQWFRFSFWFLKLLGLTSTSCLGMKELDQLGNSEGEPWVVVPNVSPPAPSLSIKSLGESNCNKSIGSILGLR